MYKKHLCLLALLACLTGCVPVDSLNPLYAAKDTLFDPALLGQWSSTNKENQGVLEFTALDKEEGKNVGYVIALISQEQDGKCGRMEYEARLVKIGERKFLDMVPKSVDLRPGVTPLRVVPSKRGPTLAPGLVKVATSGYMEFTGGAQPQASLRAAHWFFRVNFDGKKLRLDWMDDAKFLQAALDQKIRLGHALVGEGKEKEVVITAKTKELQTFVLEHGEDSEVFSEHTDEMERKQP